MKGETILPRLIYAKINKETLGFIRNAKHVTFDYVERITNFSKDKLVLWEDETSNKYPTINQAKELAKCYRVPFAGLYMNSEDINVKHLPSIINKRTMTIVVNDDSAVNLALIDLINFRDFYLETKKELNENIQDFEFKISDSLSVLEWADMIRNNFEIKLEDQFRSKSCRKFYLYIRKKIENKGIFIQGFQKVDASTLRGVAIVDNVMPIIGINDDDRYPAKSFSIIHELVHIIKRTSSICNSMFESNYEDEEEIFCNAVAGEVLVPRSALLIVLKRYSDFSIDNIEAIANRFSVSSEVIARRLYDTRNISKKRYDELRYELERKFMIERENMKKARKMGINDGPKRNMAREAIDRTSSEMCGVLLRGLSEGLFDKSDVSAQIGIGQKHINKFLSEVRGWYL